MNYLNINNRIEQLKKSGRFNSQQISVLTYASYIIGFDVNLIINPTIPSEYMTMYIRLANQGVDITKYICKNCHVTDYSANQLYHIILAHHNGYDVSSINSKMSIEQIIRIIDNQKPKNDNNKLLIK